MPPEFGSTARSCCSTVKRVGGGNLVTYYYPEQSWHDCRADLVTGGTGSVDWWEIDPQVALATDALRANLGKRFLVDGDGEWV